MKKTFSIIVPTYNEENHILVLLESLRKQEFNLKKVEVIVVDNGSIDNTLVKVKEYAKKYKKLAVILVTERKRHVSSARNKGAFIAKGEFFIFLDADNIVDPYLLQSIFTKASLQNFQAGTICALALEESLTGHILFLLLECIKILLQKPFGKNFCSKRVFKKVGGYNEKITVGTNVDFLARVKKQLAKEKKSLAHIQKAVYVSLRRFETQGYIKVLVKWFCGYIGLRNISY